MFLLSQHQNIISKCRSTGRNRQSYNNILQGIYRPLSIMGQLSKQKRNKETLELNYILDQRDLTDIYRIFHPIAVEYTLFSSEHETFSRIDHVLPQNKH